MIHHYLKHRKAEGDHYGVAANGLGNVLLQVQDRGNQSRIRLTPQEAEHVSDLLSVCAQQARRTAKLEDRTYPVLDEIWVSNACYSRDARGVWTNKGITVDRIFAVFLNELQLSRQELKIVMHENDDLRYMYKVTSDANIALSARVESLTREIERLKNPATTFQSE